MQLTITSVDHAPGDLEGQVPFVVNMIRPLPGDDRPDYWLGALQSPITWLVDNDRRTVSHLVLAARWEGYRIEARVQNMPVAIAYVVDQSLLDDPQLDFGKCEYVAIGTATDTTAGRPAPFSKRS